jgi:hypothetical protein
LVPPGNVEALATAMEKAKDEGKKRAVGKYCSGLTISEVIDEYLDVIDQNR